MGVWWRGSVLVSGQTSILPRPTGGLGPPWMQGSMFSLIPCVLSEEPERLARVPGVRDVPPLLPCPRGMARSLLQLIRSLGSLRCSSLVSPINSPAPRSLRCQTLRCPRMTPRISWGAPGGPAVRAGPASELGQVVEDTSRRVTTVPKHRGHPRLSPAFLGEAEHRPGPHEEGLRCYCCHRCFLTSL